MLSALGFVLWPLLSSETLSAENKVQSTKHLDTCGIDEIGEQSVRRALQVRTVRHDSQSGNGVEFEMNGQRRATHAAEWIAGVDLFGSN